MGALVAPAGKPAGNRSQGSQASLSCGAPATIPNRTWFGRNAPRWSVGTRGRTGVPRVGAQQGVEVHFSAAVCASDNDLVMSVSMKPGATQLTVMPRLPSSRASERVMPATPALAAA